MAEGKDQHKLAELNNKTYANQAKWFINTLWNEKFASDEAEREKIWVFTQNIIKLDKDNGAKGTGLTEIVAHIFLEKNTNSQTWTEFRDKMREIGFEHKLVSLLNFFIFNYQLDFHKLVNTVSGLDEDAEMKIAQAQEKLDEAQAALAACEKAADEAAKSAAEAAKALGEQKEAEAEVKAGLEAIEAEEAKKAAQLAKLKAQSEDESLSVVKKGKAFQEFKKLEGEDPLPLREAKIKQGAKVRKMKKATKTCQKAEQKAADAKAAAEAAAAEARASLSRAEEFLEEVKASCSGGTNDGVLWFMDRELAEARKFLPKGKAAALAKKVNQQKGALKKGGGGSKGGGAKITAQQSGNLMLEIGGGKGKGQLKRSSTRGEGVSDAVKEAFVADAKGEPDDDDDEQADE